MNIAIFIADSNGAFSVPASKGGAVATLVEHLVKEGNKDCDNKLTVISYYDEEAYKLSYKYPNVSFHWVSRPGIIRLLDTLIFRFVQLVFKNKKSISFATLFSLGWYILISGVYLRKSDFDKVVLENNIPLAWIIRLSGFRGDYYYHFHNIPRVNAKCHKVFEECKAFLCVSKYVGEQIKSPSNAIGPAREKQIRVLYNCIDTSLFKPRNHEECRKMITDKYKLPNDKKIIVFVGRLSKEKGIDLLLKACKLLKRNDFVLLIVGSFIQGVEAKDSYEEYLVKLSNMLNVEVCYAGYVQQRDLPIIYSGSDLAVLPSIWDEPAGLTMVEAINCGVALITTKSGGIPEYITSDCAIFLERNDKIVDNLSKMIDQCLNDSNYQLIDNGLERGKLFSSKNYYKNFIRILKDE